MGTIRILPRHLSELIAAGEVCERPASVVKELVENSLDARAENITVTIEEGGLKSIKITDDGCGMDSDDALLCLSRHATSKLREDSLNAISTMGFRGEALAAISAVSKLSLTTKTHGAVEGSYIGCEGGDILEQTPAGCAPGTEIRVDSLFYNTPARLKFMKKNSSEASLIEGVVERAAFSRPDVSFKLIKDGKEVLHTPGDGSLLSCLYCVFGREYAASLYPFDYEYNGVIADGFACRASSGRGNRSMQYFNVNTRPVKNRMLSAALEEAYKNAMPFGKYASCFINITLPCEQVDVNIHPAKSEVRFVRERDVFDCVYFGIKKMLTEHGDLESFVLSGKTVESPVGTPPAVEAPPPKPAFVSVADFPNEAQTEPTADTPARAVPSFSPSSERLSSYEIAYDKGVTGTDKTPSAQAVYSPQEEERGFIDIPKYRYKCELFKTYIVAEGINDCYIIDKHAAHERIKFEELIKSESDSFSQYLLVPAVVKLPPDEISTLLSSTADLNSAGYEIEEFGSGSILVRRIPEGILDSELALVMSELAGLIADGKRYSRLSVREKLLYSVACHSAIRAGDRSSDSELEALCTRVLELNDIRYCPHGRPCAFKLPKSELEKRFGR